MNESEYLLVCLLEELSETQKEVCKALRFGLDDCNPNDEKKIPNRERIQREISHINVIILRLVRNGVLTRFSDDDGKEKRLDEFMQYSKDRGCLQSGK